MGNNPAVLPLGPLGTTTHDTTTPEPGAMVNKRAKTKKPKQKLKKNAGAKGGQISMEDMGSPSPVRKPKKKG
jgi:hypothetical protein